MEIIMQRDLALRLGAVTPENVRHHRAMRNAGDMLIRDRATMWPLFWQWQISPQDIAAERLADLSDAIAIRHSRRTAR